MCDSADDIDEIIEFELTRDSDEMNEETILYEEIQDEYEVQAVVLTEGETDAEVDTEPEDELEAEPEVDTESEEHLEQADQMLQVEQDEQEDDKSFVLASAPYEIQEESAEVDVIETKPVVKHSVMPSRYLLFDELIATIVDYTDETPIVEFALSGTEEDEKLPVECGICPDVMHKSQLNAHLKTHLVPGTSRYACIYCDETYKDYKYLAGHARRHMGIRPYVCDPCKLYFSTKQDLRVHNQRRHQEKEHICEICGKTFSQNTMLKRHRESTHEKKRRFQCLHCSKAYYKNFSLQEHIRNVHMGKRRMLVCQFCGMQCRDAHKMARHRKMLHLNQSHYQCEICQEEFTDINYFDAHKRSIQCRNNTRRKLEEEELQLQQQEEFVYEITLEENDIN